MQKFVRVLTVALGCLAAAAVAVSGQGPVPSPWAYGYNAAGPDPAAPPCPREAKPLECARLGAPRPNDVVHTLPGADRSFTEFQIHYDYGPADAYPGDHPAMPDIVAHGRESDTLRACALCHFPNGQGKPENAPVAGLPAAYILQQLEAFRNGTRTSADPRKANTSEMIQIARFLTEAEMKIAAEYFSSIRWKPWVRVVESETAPKTRQTMNGLFMPQPGTETEPLGRRIMEVPENPDLTDRMRSTRSGFVAYVPVGSVARGEELVTKGGGKTVQCTLCHGPDLQGLANVPGIADRQASYIVRQLVDMQAGTRQSAMMKPVVAKLNEDDMIAIVAYLASR
ncbi:MAG: c-type cytochrome [Acidobacteria bacterium]|nr:c-type cytochrome [Acidobacteriota bacterium]